MRKRIFALILAMCLLLAGCAPAGQETQGSTHPSAGEETHEAPDLGLKIAFTELGNINLTHSVNVSYAVYVTRAEDVPNYAQFSEFDEAWFENHALLLIYESVASRNVQVSVESILKDGETARITLAHETDASAGAALKVTKLVWLEVEQGLQFSWIIENPALPSEVTDK